MDTLALEMTFNKKVRNFVNSSMCPVTKLPLDVGPRGNEWLRPTEFEGQLMSWLGRAILESEITADELTEIAKSMENNG